MKVRKVGVVPIKRKGGGWTTKVIDIEEEVLPEREDRDHGMCQVCPTGDNGRYPGCKKMCGLN